MAADECPSIATHPHDSDVVLTGVGAITGPDAQAADVPTVVSLCRMDQNDLALPNVERRNWIQVPLVDKPRGNAHTQFLVDQAVDAAPNQRLPYLQYNSGPIATRVIVSHRKTLRMTFRYLGFLSCHV